MAKKTVEVDARYLEMLKELELNARTWAANPRDMGDCANAIRDYDAVVEREKNPLGLLWYVEEKWGREFWILDHNGKYVMHRKNSSEAMIIATAMNATAKPQADAERPDKWDRPVRVGKTDGCVVLSATNAVVCRAQNEEAAKFISSAVNAYRLEETHG